MSVISDKLKVQEHEYNTMEGPVRVVLWKVRAGYVVERVHKGKVHEYVDRLAPNARQAVAYAMHPFDIIPESQDEPEADYDGYLQKQECEEDKRLDRLQAEREEREMDPRVEY